MTLFENTEDVYGIVTKLTLSQDLLSYSVLISSILVNG